MRKKKFSMKGKYARTNPLAYVNDIKKAEGIGKASMSQFLIMNQSQVNPKFIDHGKNLAPIVQAAKDEEVKLYEMADKAMGSGGSPMPGGGGGGPVGDTLPPISGLAQLKSPAKYHDDISKDKNPDGWAKSHRADGTARSGMETKLINKALSLGDDITLPQAIAAAEQRVNELKDDQRKPEEPDTIGKQTQVKPLTYKDLLKAGMDFWRGPKKTTEEEPTVEEKQAIKTERLKTRIENKKTRKERRAERREIRDTRTHQAPEAIVKQTEDTKTHQNPEAIVGQTKQQKKEIGKSDIPRKYRVEDKPYDDSKMIAEVTKKIRELESKRKDSGQVKKTFINKRLKKLYNKLYPGEETKL